MEDLTVEEPILDIDVSDAKNSLAAVEYVQDLYAFYRTIEVNYGLVLPVFEVISGLRASLKQFLI